MPPAWRLLYVSRKVIPGLAFRRILESPITDFEVLRGIETPGNSSFVNLDRGKGVFQKTGALAVEWTSAEAGALAEEIC